MYEMRVCVYVSACKCVWGGGVRDGRVGGRGFTVLDRQGKNRRRGTLVGLIGWFRFDLQCPDGCTRGHGQAGRFAHPVQRE